MNPDDLADDPEATSQWRNAVKFGAGGAVGGGVAGTLVGWGGVGVAAAGGAVGLPIIATVAVGAAAGVGVVAAARALRGPVAQVSAAARDRFGDSQRETTGGASGSTEADSAVDDGARDATESRGSQAGVAAGAVAAAGVAASVIPKLRRKVFKNAEPGRIKVPPNARKRLYEEQGGICNGCENSYLFKDMTLDHIVPRSKGGTNKIENLQLLCHHCNSIKGNRPWDR